MVLMAKERVRGGKRSGRLDSWREVHRPIRKTDIMETESDNVKEPAASVGRNYGDYVERDQPCRSRAFFPSQRKRVVEAIAPGVKEENEKAAP